jgi:uncharacterized membrane protein YraQ (UPF0718 family)
MTSFRWRWPFDVSTTVIATLGVAAGIAVYWRDGPDKALAILTSDLGLFVDILPKVLAGCLIGGFVTLLLPREAVGRRVGGESGVLGLVIAAAAGIILPGGPYTIYPVAGAFLAAGADVGAAIAFVTSWTLLGYTRALVWELPFFGPDFVFWRIIVSLPLPILAGLLARFVWRAIQARTGSAKSGDTP